MGYELIHSDNSLLVPLSLIDRQIVDMYSSGCSLKSISLELGCPPSIIKRVLAKPEVRDIVNSLVMDTGVALKAERFRLLNAIIEDKLKVIEEQIDEDGNPTGRLANASNKDIVDLISLVDSIGKEKEKKELGTGTNNIYLQLINGLM